MCAFKFSKTCLHPAVSLALITWIACGLISCRGNVWAQENEQGENAEGSRMQALYNSIQWQVGPTTANIGNNAQIDLPEGYQYTGKDGARKWNELTENPPTDDLGVLMSSGGDKGWFVVFSFDDVGYVPDDEKDDWMQTPS